MGTKFYISILMVLILLTPNVTATTFKDSKRAGITPDSKLWVLDKFLEKVELKLARTGLSRVQKRMKFAEERMAESIIMLGEKDIKSSLKALEAQEELINEANADTRQIKDYEGLTIATRAISKHRVKIEEQKEKVLETLPEGSTAKERVEMAFDKSIITSDEIEGRLNKMMEKHQDKIGSFLKEVSDVTKIDITGAYRDLMETGTVDYKIINEAVIYANDEITSKNIDIKSLEGRTIKVNLFKEGINTQTITFIIRNGAILGGNIGNTIELNINIEDVPTYIERLIEEDYDYFKQEFIKKGGKSSIGILISLDK